MKVDFHFHLEEGPYTLNWLQRTSLALQRTRRTTEASERLDSLESVQSVVRGLSRRMDEGCFSERWITKYIEQGTRQGIEHFGVVDHLYRFVEFKPYYEKHMLIDGSPLGQLQQAWLNQVCVYSIREYLDGVQNVARFYGNLSIGIEADYFENGEEELEELLSSYSFDYVIGSVHFLNGWGFDNPNTQHLFKGRQLEDLYAQHFENVIRAVNSGLFQFIAHLDNLKVFGFRPSERDLLGWYDAVAAALAHAGVASEINTGLAYRYPVKEMCPSPNFLRVLHRHGVPVTLSSDAHFPDDIGTMLDEAIIMAKSIGYEDIVYFKNKQQYSLPI
ncbi:histidinol-phosphatase HisJ family protein [Paenibacillus sp. YPG26]|uniref:histidinol-phosphatase HisJ family protein n=1 Tax=Paenibacillus sp. YPG26 TaxID=2878915 RepID=UPI00203C9086|nr:histidinol-phosphatase HisJ family protein [Paenibacillus sp. YPG26]USB31614.1 histidinol-phosphatase HisJ family protein [Paenibacillus sp. YPG26]